jgi:hypothetical protein
MNALFKQIFTVLLLALALSGCAAEPSAGRRALAQTVIATAPRSPTRSDSTGKRYFFYLHGKIFEDQGIPAISPEYGEYQYQAILNRLSGFGFEIISEKRPMNTDALEYAQKTAGQVTSLLQSGVPAKNITIVGASKGASIAMFVSCILENSEINYVILAGCNAEMMELLKTNRMSLYGNVLSIYDSADTLAGSCQDIFSISPEKGLTRHNEIVLTVGAGHGVLYKPLDEWILPTVQWAGEP